MQLQRVSLDTERRSWVRRIPPTPSLIVALTAIAYLALSSVATLLDDRNDLGAVTRPAAGLAVAAALLVPTRSWGWVALGIASGQTAYILLHGSPLSYAAVGSTVACIEALGGAAIVRRLGNPDGELVPVRNYAAFLLGGVIAGPLLAGVVGLAAIEASGGDVVRLAPHLVLSDMLGVLLFAPLFLAPSGRVRRSRPELVGLYASVVVGSVAVFFHHGGGWGATLPYILLPLLGWAAFRFGSRATVNCGLIVYLVGNIAVVTDSSPFNAVRGSTFEHAIALRVFVAVAVAGGLFLAAVVEDLVDVTAVQSQLRRAALTDPLTGLPNRSRLDELLLLHHGVPHTVLLWDIDRFKRINDGYGHHVGDRVIVSASQRVSGVLPPGAHLVRYGGDEFIVLLPTVGRDEVDAVLAAMERVVAQPLAISDRVSLTTTLSIGIAGTDSSPPADLLRHADAALHAAKDEGRNRARRFDAPLRARVDNETFVEREIEAALVAGQLVCSFQPEVVLHSEDLFGVEALVRWHHPERGCIPPDQFVAIVEELGLADDLLHTVLEQSVRWQARWQAHSGTRPIVSVNLSPNQLCNTELVESVFRTVAAGGSTPRDICLEVTEGTLIDERAGDALRELTSLGFQLAIDDFGTGWASMGRLAAYQWDLLKIDRSFVAGIGEDHDAESIVATSIALAHSLGIRAVAEGVETEFQLQRLRALDCDIVQGYLLGRPVSGDDIADRLRATDAAGATGAAGATDDGRSLDPVL